MKKIFFSIILVFTSYLSFAQGCSDAGICSIGHAFDTSQKELKNSIEVATTFGIGVASVTYISPYIGYTRNFNERISLSTKVTFSSANGSLGTKSGLGDAFLIGNYTFKEKNDKQWSALVGGKFPFSNSNLKNNGNALPLDYQPSLGTFDLFLGSSLKYKKWNFNTAIQIPVINTNENTYFAALSESSDFPSTNLFERKPDALFRTTYTMKASNQKFTFKPNVLFIYHLGEDSYETTTGKRENIDGSEGLTVKANLNTNYSIKK